METSIIMLTALVLISISFFIQLYLLRSRINLIEEENSVLMGILLRKLKEEAFEEKNLEEYSPADDDYSTTMIDNAIAQHKITKNVELG